MHRTGSFRGCPRCFLKRPAPRWRTGLRVAHPRQELVDCNHRRAGDDGDGRHHKYSFQHGAPRRIFAPRRQTNQVPARPENYGCRKFAKTDPVAAAAGERYSIANALETIATGLLLSVAETSVTRPKLMVRPRLTTRASASTSEDITARMKCVVWSTVVIGR